MLCVGLKAHQDDSISHRSIESQMKQKNKVLSKLYSRPDDKGNHNFVNLPSHKQAKEAPYLPSKIGKSARRYNKQLNKHKPFSIFSTTTREDNHVCPQPHGTCLKPISI